MLSEHSVRQALRQCGHSAQVIIGDADPRYDAAVLADLAEAGVNVVIVPGADHGLDIEGDAVASARLMAQLITEIRDFGFRSSERRPHSGDLSPTC